MEAQELGRVEKDGEAAAVKHTITLVSGDGIGPEVATATTKAVEAVVQHLVN